MQYLALYVVLFIFVILSFLRGKHVLFNVILMVYPTAIIYTALLGAGGEKWLRDINLGSSTFITHLVLFLIILCPVYISMMRIVSSFHIGHSLKGVAESIILSLGIVILTIGVCFHILPDTDVFSLSRPFESFFQSDLGYLVCMIVPMIAVFVLSKRPSIDLH